MESERQHFRAMILYDLKSSLNQVQSLERLTQFFRGLAPSRATVYNWFVEFKRGRTSLEDEERSGRLSMAVIDDSIDAVEKMVREDARVTYKDIEAFLRIGSGSVAKFCTPILGSARCHLAGCHTISMMVRSLEWNGAAKCFRDSTMGSLAAFLRSLQVTRPGFTSMIQKQSISHRSGCSLMMIDLSK